MSSKKQFKYLNVIRLVSLVGILFYHFNIIKGGFLAVCTFFTLSGYLSCASAFDKEKFSIFEYYKNKFIKIYLPLLIVVFLSIIVISLNSNIIWLNLKPETTSVIGGYNNFWQLNANLDYFARHVNSPFMHFWYIAILLQFELIFPILFIGLKKIAEKINKYIPIAILLLLASASLIYFYQLSTAENIMFSYYNSLARVFSILFGMALGFIHHYYKPLIFSKFNDKGIFVMLFYAYLLLFSIITQIFGFDSNYYNIIMILITFISLRMIEYAYLLGNDYDNKILTYFSKLSYWIYLLQYPLIFIFQYIELNEYLEYEIIILIILVLSMIFNFMFEKSHKYQIIRKLLLYIVLIGSLYGVYLYAVTEDHTEEMKMLEQSLNRNQELMEERQKEYEENEKEEIDEWNAIFEDLENGEEKLKEMVSNLPVVGLGDSVMLGAVPNLYSTFKKGYFDAGVSRTCYVADGILTKIKKKKKLGDVVVFNYGANGDCSEAHKNKIMNIIGDKKLFWLTVTNDKSVHFNNKIKKYAANHDNIYIIDWEEISKGHSEYFYSDGIHLNSKGRKAFAKAIYDSIYNVYLEEYNKKKEEVLNKYQEEINSKISFFGNDALINAYVYLKEEFSKSNFITETDNNYMKIKSLLIKSINEEKINNKVVFVFDRGINISNREYKELVDLCKGHEIYIIAFNNISNIGSDVKIIDFYKEIEANKDYLMPDKIHLTDKGNKALTERLTIILKNN